MLSAETYNFAHSGQCTTVASKIRTKYEYQQDRISSCDNTVGSFIGLLNKARQYVTFRDNVYNAYTVRTLSGKKRTLRYVGYGTYTVGPCV